MLGGGGGGILKALFAAQFSLYKNVVVETHNQMNR